MKLAVEDLQSVVVLTVQESKLDASISMMFKECAIRELRDDRSIYLLDLTSTMFLDSSGIGAIVGIRKALGRDGRLDLCGLNPAVDRVFSLLKLKQLFKVHETRTAALAEHEIDDPGDSAWQQADFSRDSMGI